MKTYPIGNMLLAIISALALSGCADLRLYNAGQDNLAKQAAAAIHEADIGNSLVPERAAMATLAAAEQDIVWRDQIGRRDRKLIVWLTGKDQTATWDDLDQYVAKRLKALNGSSDQALIQRVEGYTSVLKTNNRTFQDEAQRLLNQTGGVSLNCPPQASLLYPPGTEKAILLALAYDACNNIIDSQGKLANDLKLGGEIAQLNFEIEAISGEQTAIKDQLGKATLHYNEALRRFNDSRGGGAGAISDLTSALGDLEKLPLFATPARIKENPVLKHLVDVGKIEQLEQKRALIRKLLAALDTGKTAENPGDAENNAAAIGAVLHAIGDDPKKPMTGLLLESEFLRQEIIGRQMQVNRAENQIQLKRAKLASMRDELDFILNANKAKLEYDNTSLSCPAIAGRSMYETWEKASKICRNLIVQRLINILNAITFGQAQQELIYYQLIAQSHDAALDSSEVAITQVDTLIRLPLAQLVKAYGSGITPQQLGNLINALGLGAIAIGVN